MATIINRPNGTREIRFQSADRKRPTIRIGRCDAKAAARVLYHVERIVEAQSLSRPIAPDTLDYLSEMSDALYARFVRAGLVLARVAPEAGATLEARFDAFSARRTDLKPGTLLIFKQARRHLVTFFKDARLADSITVGEAKDFRRYLIGKYSEAYTAKMIRTVRQVWLDAIDRELFTSNPWKTVRAGSKRNTERQFFVTRDVIDRVIEEAPNAQWRLIIALSRYGGLRCPSEHLALTWSDIDWANNRMTIRA